MKIGIVADAKVNAGGGYHVIESAACFFKNINVKDSSFEIITTYKNSYDNLEKIVGKNNLVLFDKENFFNKINLFLYKINFIKYIFDKFTVYNSFEKFIFKKKYDLIYFITPSSMVVYCRNINFIYSIWEFAYKISPFFPEYKKNYIELREQINKFVCDNAYKIILFGNREKSDFLKLNNLNEQKIESLVFPPILSTIKNQSENMDISSYIKDKDYLFYPAQFWPHKNHIYILESLNQYNKKNTNKMHVVFTGGNMGNLHIIKKKIKELKLENFVKIYSYLSNEDIVNLYKNSFCVLFPSFVGAESYPLFESLFFKKPIMYNEKIIDKVYSDCVLKLNIDNLASLEKNINFLKDNKEKVNKLIENGSDLYHQIFDENKMESKISKMIIEYANLQKLWN